MKGLFKVVGMILITLFPLHAKANDGLAFLKLGPTSREQALANTGVASGKGAALNYYNPAWMVGRESSSVSFSQNFWLLDTYSSFVSAAFTEESSAIGVSLAWLSVKDIPVRTSPTLEPIGFINSQNAALGVSYARAVSEKLNLGIGLKLLYEKLYYEDATGYGLDFSSAYAFSSDLKVGLSLQNVGSMSKLASESSTLPTLLRSGVSYNYHFQSIQSQLLTEISIISVFSETSSVHVGHEFGYNNLFFARIGYIFGNDTRSFSTGFGLNYNNWSIDYAFIPFSNDLGSANLFTIQYNY